MSKNTLGIYCKKNKTFYFLESGSATLTTSISRLKKTLIQRGLIAITDKSYTDVDQYEVLKIKEAEERELTILPIYLNKHIKNTIENGSKNENKKW